jgi:osmoprotectant transport system substrate-binding protein
MRRPALFARAAALAAAALVLAACGGGSDPLASGSGGATGSAAPTDTIVVGSANFTESQILAEIYAQALQAKGVTVEKRLNIGSRETYIPGLQDGSLDLMPEYTGVLLQYFDKAATAAEPDAVYTALQGAVPQNLTVLERSAAEDKDAVVVTRETATRLNVRSLEDLGPQCGQLVFGGPPEFQTRPDGIPGLQETYNCTFKEYRSLDAGGPLTVAALKNNDVQAANLFTTDAAIPTNDFVVLEDPKNNFAAQNVVPLINKAKATEVVITTLNDISSRLTTENLTALNAEAASDAKPSPETVAKNWLSQNGLT